MRCKGKLLWLVYASVKQLGVPLRFVEVFCVRQIILAGTRWQTVRVKRCGAVTDLTNLAGTRRGNVPGVPGGREHMLSTQQNTPNAIIGPADLVVEGWDAGTGCGREPSSGIGRAAI